MHHILLVDDDDDSRGALKALLEVWGYEVDEAADGRRALDHILAHEEPSLIILDLEMPVMSGAELVGVMRRDQRLLNIPVLVLSGSSKSDMPVDEAIVGFLQKPCNGELLLEVIRETVGNAAASPAGR
jgi:CheY-like chemotaxis protein